MPRFPRVARLEGSGGWYGLLRGGLKASATAALDMGMTADEQRFLATRAGAIVSEQVQGAVSVTY